MAWSMICIKQNQITKEGGMLRFWNVLVLVLVMNFESIFCDLLASVSLVNKNGCKHYCLDTNTKTKTFQSLNKNCP